MKKQYYRIVFFRGGEFKKLKVTDDEREVDRLINSGRLDVEIFKCNPKGNNYTDRQVYPNGKGAFV